MFVILMGFLAAGLQAMSMKLISPSLESAWPGFSDTGVHHALITVVTLVVPALICHMRVERFTGRFSGLKTTLVWGGVFSVVIILFNIALFETASLIATGKPHVPGITAPQTGISLFVAMAVLGPLAEEALYRGYILKVLMEKNSLVGAVLITSLMAVMIHAVKYPRLEITYFIVKFIQSAIISLAYVKGRLGASIGVHIINNITALTAF
jgi:membrane protease YdiL (CAAX protease family)